MSAVEYGLPWNRARRESLLKASSVRSRRASRFHTRNWKRIRPSAWTNCTGWASFKQTVTVYRPVHLEDESKVLQSWFHIEIPHVMSDPERGRICGLLERLFGSRLPGISSPHSPSEVMLTPRTFRVQVSVFLHTSAAVREHALEPAEVGSSVQIFSLADFPELYTKKGKPICRRSKKVRCPNWLLRSINTADFLARQGRY